MARERGSVLMLMPAAVLVLLVLGAIAVDSAVVFLAQRELSNAAAGAANDAATRAIDEASFYGEGVVVLDADTARRVAEQALRVRVPRYVEDARVDVAVASGEPTVTVRIDADVEYIFAKALPGVRHRAHVRATASATARRR